MAARAESLDTTPFTSTLGERGTSATPKAPCTKKRKSATLRKWTILTGKRRVTGQRLILCILYEQAIIPLGISLWSHLYSVIWFCAYVFCDFRAFVGILGSFAQFDKYGEGIDTRPWPNTEISFPWLQTARSPNGTSSECRDSMASSCNIIDCQVLGSALQCL